MEKTIENQITYYFENNKVISKEELMIAIRNDFPNWSDNTINAYLYLLKKRGIINSLSRGIYTLGKVETFNPLISEQLKKIAYRIHKAYPFINYCVWDSSWLHDLMRHQPSNTYHYWATGCCYRKAAHLRQHHNNPVRIVTFPSSTNSNRANNQ